MLDIPTLIAPVPPPLAHDCTSRVSRRQDISRLATERVGLYGNHHSASVLGLLFRPNVNEWCWFVLAMASVWTAGALYIALEFLCDVASQGFQPLTDEPDRAPSNIQLLLFSQRFCSNA